MTMGNIVKKATQKPTITYFFSTQFQILSILITGIIAYANSFTVPMQFDDFTTIGGALTNFSSGGPGLLTPGASRWITDATFAINRYIHGSQVAGYHILNLTIHMSATLAVYRLLTLLLETLNANTSGDTQHFFLAKFVPFGAALLFVCHPIQTEAVTYISQRYASLTAFFYLISLYSYIQARRAMVSCQTSPLLPNGLVWWLAFVFSAVLAMKCKQISMTLPLTAVILECFCFRGKLLKKPIFVILLTGLLFIVPVQEFYSHNFSASQSVSEIVQRASSETSTISRYSYFLTQQRVEITYLRLLLFPVNQNLDYDYPVFSSIREWPVWISLSIHLLLVGFAMFILVRQKRVTDNNSLAADSAMRLLGIGIVWFYLTLSIESSLIPIRDVIFEHRLYLPSVGFFIALTAGVGWVIAPRPHLQKMAWCSLAILAASLTASTVARNMVWSSELTMWQDVLKKSPNKARVRSYVGLHYAKQLVLDKAVQNLVRAIELDQINDRYRIYLNHTVTMIAGLKKRSSSGIKYQSGLEAVDPKFFEPWLAVSYNNLGLAYEFMNNDAVAKINYFKAINIDHTLDLAWYNIALLAAKHLDTEGYNQAVYKLGPLNPELYKQLPKLTQIERTESDK